VEHLDAYSKRPRCPSEAPHKCCVAIGKSKGFWFFHDLLRHILRQRDEGAKLVGHAELLDDGPEKAAAARIIRL
jgi:hypothetical protein